MATTDMQRLIVSLEARTKAFENALNKANGVANRRARAIETRFSKMNKAVSGSFAGVGRGMAAAFAGAVSIRGAQQLIDAATSIENALKVTGLAGDELTKVYDRLFDSATRNAAPLEDLVTLYSRASMAAQNLGASQDDLLKFSDNVALSLRVSGKSAQEASGALLQLSQVLGGSVVQAQEYNSLIDGAYPLLQAVAAGLKEAGGDVSKLTQLVKSSSVPTKAFFDAFQVGSAVLQDKVASSVFTISQRLTNMRTALVDAAGRFNKSSNAANTFGTAIDNVANFVNGINFDTLIDEISRIIQQFRDGVNWANNFANTVAELSGLDNVGQMLTGGDVQKSYLGGALTITSSKALRERIEGAFGQQIEATGDLTEKVIRDYAANNGITPGKADRVATKPGFTPVSLDNYELKGGTKSGSGRKRQSEYAREIEQIKERTAALQAETAAMAGLNPLVNDYGFALEKASAVQELLNAAQQAGLTITPELRASIEGLATGYATAVVEAEKLAEKQDRVREASEELRDLGKDVMGGFISDLRSGKSAAEALQGALDKVIDKLIEVSLASIFDTGGSGLLGGLGALFGLKDGGPVKMASGGRVSGPGGPRSDKVPAMLSNGEYVVNAAAASRNPGLLEAINSGRIAHMASGGPVGRIPSGGAMGQRETVVRIIAEESSGFTQRVTEISGQTAGVVIQQARPQLAQEAVRSVQSASRNRPGYFR